MATLGLRRFVLVTAITSIGHIVVRMADLAGDISAAAMIHGKGVIAQPSGQPGRGRVASRTVAAKTPFVEIGFGMAGDATGGQFFERLLRVAVLARQRSVGSIQRKDGLMIERSQGYTTIVAGKEASSGS